MTQENKDLDESKELQDDAIQEIHQNLLKDKELPKEGFSFLPIALIFLFAGISTPPILAIIVFLLPLSI